MEVRVHLSHHVKVLIIQLSLETHSRHVGRIVARIEAEVSSPLGENAYFSALQIDLSGYIANSWSHTDMNVIAKLSNSVK